MNEMSQKGLDFVVRVTIVGLFVACVFTALRLGGVVGWSWWIVTVPVWGTLLPITLGGLLGVIAEWGVRKGW